MRRHSEVGQYAVDTTAYAEIVAVVLEVAEVAVHRRKALVGKGAAYGVHILVEAVEVAFGPQSLHYGAAMASTSEGGVDIYATRVDVECFEALWQ